MFCVAWVLALSCQSSANIRYMVPSDVDLSEWREITLLPIQGGYRWKNPPGIYFDALDRYMQSGDCEGNGRILSYALNSLASSLDATGYFHIVSSDQAKSAIQMRIDTLSVDEIPREKEITGERTVVDEGAKKRVRAIVGTEYLLDQRVFLRLSWRVNDIASGALLASDSYEAEKHLFTTVAKRYYADGGYWDEDLWLSARSPSVMGMQKELVDSFVEKIIRTISPTWRTQRITLLGDTQKSERFKVAGNLASKGLLEEACRQFLLLWQEEKSEHAAVNAALLFAALDKWDEALSLMEEAAGASADQKVLEKKAQLEKMASSHREAKRQFDGLL